jgi:predicted MFS family arabinose efflux permease
MSDRLFSPRFFVMCGFTFTVFLSAFQLLPTAPFRIHELGGSTFASGLFLGFLTYASAFSAPLTGALSDRIGRRRTLVIASGVILLCAIAYALTSSYRLMLALVVVHGVFWSALLSASAAYLTGLLPERRRAEGIAYWGLSSVAAIAVAPPIAFWLLERGGWRWICISCGALNVLMGAIAWNLDPDQSPTHHVSHSSIPLIEWRVLVLSLTLFLYSFGYGGITSFSAIYADAIGVTPKSLYLTVLAVVILFTRPLSGLLGDRIGYRRIFIPSLVLIAFGLALLSIVGTRASLVVSAIVFGNAYPAFVAYVLRDVTAARRGAAFGAILAAFDTGVGTGSTSVGWLIERYGFATAFGTTALLSAVALPYFLVTDRRLAQSHDSSRRLEDTKTTKTARARM